MSKLNGLDAMFLNVDRPHAASHCTMIYIYDQSTVKGQRLGFRDVVRHIESRLDASPTFRRKIVQVPFGLGYPYWVEDDLFDIDFHVRHFALPKPGDWRQFCILVSRIHARAVDLSRAPWEMYVIEGLDNVEGIPKGSFAILTKTHHAATDGTAAAELTWALHDLAGARGKSVPVTAARKTAEAKRTRFRYMDAVTRMLTDNVSASVRMAVPLARVLPKLATTGVRSFARSLLAGDGGAPRTRFNADVSARRVWDSVTLDLADIKRIKNLVPGATVNDAVLALIGGGLRRYLVAKDELPAKSLVSLAPVNTRQDSSENQTAGNTVSMLRFPLGTNLDDPLERLQAIQAATSESKTVQQAIGARELTDLQKFTPPATLGLAGRLATATGMGGKGPVVLHNCMVTNVPGPNVPLYMLGAKLVHWGGVGPLVDGLSLIFNPTSYCGKLFISMTSAPNVLPDPEFLSRCLNESFEEMRKLTGAEGEKTVVEKVEAKATKPRAAAKKVPAAKRARAAKVTEAVAAEQSGLDGEAPAV
ncbi:wax ester/triacylglycerol synthase family O-acyltransferase [Pseudomonas sp. Milli4]|uniref:diacylglycerol O-acyltransferase n=1 Tax=Pseudomonas schmalbachii TaxID=2816993 RepID=A0ABS3TK77_9PSED|nr:wax ester/triacylglycerol synthase family O-acyltransferase [Pseudomonas schmalbachii]